jgi:hypothetical protein
MVEVVHSNDFAKCVHVVDCSTGCKMNNHCIQLIKASWALYDAIDYAVHCLFYALRRMV